VVAEATSRLAAQRRQDLNIGLNGVGVAPRCTQLAVHFRLYVAVAKDGHLVVTTGCTHFEVIPGKEALLADLVFGLCSEAFRVQMRALATGSDGLSSISSEDICSIVLPKIKTEAVRQSIVERINEARLGQLVLPRVVRDELAIVAPTANVPLRSSHVVQV